MKTQNQSPTGQHWLFGQHRWVPFVLPLLVFLVSGQFDSLFSNSVVSHADNSVDTSNDRDSATLASEALNSSDFDSQEVSARQTNWYPLVYSGRVLLTLAAMVLAWPAYRQFQFRISRWAVVCGIVGVMLWIGLCALRLEERFILPLLSVVFGEGGRAAYNPLEQLAGRPWALVGFLAVRFLGLAFIVPVIEEFFLRGFLQRFVMAADWWTLPVGTANAMAWAAIVVYAVVTHPGEMVAAAVWFSLVTWLAARTQNIWDAVTAHAVTNFLLGVYVLLSGEWRLW